MKHKLLTLLLVIIASVGTMFAQSGTCGNNLTWNLTNGVLTISGSGNMYPYNPPDEEDSQHLVAPWEPYRQSITSVVILEGVISIGTYAFGECKNLTSVSIPSSVTSIGSWAFYGCSGLTVLTIPSSITKIEYRTFYGCSSLTSVTIPNSVTSIEQETFKYCSALVSVTIPNSVTSIGTGAFQNCIGLTSVTIPNSVTSIGSWAFASCSSLTSITIPVNVKNIGYNAFENCRGLTAVNISDLNAWCNISFSTLFSNPLYYAKNLYLKGVLVQELILPNSVNSIGNYAFAGCSMTSVTIPNSVNSIGNYAFAYCDGLTSIVIPNSVTSIEGCAFENCSSLTSVTNYATTPQAINEYVFDNVNISACTLYVPAGSLAAYKKATIWKNFGTILAIGGDTPCTPISGTCGANLTWELSCDSVLTISGTGAMADFNSTSDNPWYAHRNAIKSVIIGNGITSIGKGAFYNCSVLTSVTIGNSVKSIEQGAFQNCSGLPSIVIPNSVTSIEYGAFKGCTVLSSVTMGNSIKSLGDYAFENCSSLNSVTIPNSITSIGYGAFGNCSGLTSVTLGEKLANIGNFAFYNCSGLTSVTNYATTPQTIDEYVFGSVNISACSLHVLVGSVTAYKAASVWKDFGTIQAISGDTPCTPISGTCGTNLTWKLSCDGVLTISGTGAMADFNSASDIPWYEYRDAIKSIVISKGVTSIASNAFQKCTNLTSVTIPTSVTSIGQVAFYECIALASVAIPNSVKSIGMGAFTYCSSLTSITIPNSVTSIGQAAFGYCTGLRSVTIGSGITSIEQGVFGNCSSLTSVTIPSNVTSIGQVAFYNCTGLTSVTIPSSVTSIGMGAFSGCSSLTSVTIPNGITSIEQETFGNCSSLTSIVIPNGVTSIGDWAFQNCAALTSVEIPNSVTSISDEVFSGCTALRSVTNYATTPQTIDEYVFDNVNISACTLYVPAGSLAAYKKATIWKDFGRIQAIGGNTPCLIASGTCGENLTWTLSCDSVLTISGTGDMTDYSLSSHMPWYTYCFSITSVVIGNGVTSIGDYAFRNCTGLTSVTIPNSVTSIGRDAFHGCSGLTFVTIPNSVTSIGNRAFQGCSSLNSVTIPNSITSIGYGAFSNCSGLTSVTNYATTPQTIDEYVFGSVNISACSLHVPVGSVTAYKAASVWKDFGTIQAIGGSTPCLIASGTCGENLTWKLSCDSVLTISGTGAMTDYTSSSSAPWYEHRNDVKSVLIDNNVTSIGNYAFRNCTSLTSVEIPNSVTSIGASAFHGCSSLVSVTIPNSVTSIGAGAFYNCSGLTSVTIPNSVTSIGNDAFGNCSSLTSIHVANDNPNYYSVEGVLFNKYMTTLVQCPGGKQGAYIIPNSVTSIGDRAFQKCTNLTSVTIPNSVTSIGSSAFRSCTGLKSVTIGSGVANIGSGAFYNCSSLTYVTNYATNPQTINEKVFGSVDISSCTLQVPAGSVTAYKAAAEWKNFGTIQAIGGGTPCSPISGICGGNLTWELTCDSVLTISGTGTMPDFNSTSDNPWYAHRNAIKSVIIGNRVTSIGNYAFSGFGLTSVTIPNSVTSIGSRAFYGCSGLTSVTIPNSVTSIGNYAFSGCGLTSVTINSDAIMKNTLPGASFADIFGYQVKNYMIGNGVTSIGDWAFYNCSGLTSVTIPNSVTSIGEVAFLDCSSLTSVTIPSSVTSIGMGAFSGCSSLTSIVIPNGVTSIGDWAFENCTALTSVTIPSSVTSIGDEVFSGCTGLRSVTNYATTPQTIDAYVFDDVNISACTLYVPAGSLAAYRTADVWKEFGQILPINAEDVDVTKTTVTASATTADIVWPKVTGAVTYTLEIKKNGELICTLTFDAEGHLISMSFAAPSRHNAPHQTQAAGFSFTITGLESGTTYSYTMIVKGSDGNVLKTESGTFTTIGAEGIEDAQSDQVQSTKILRNGQIYILRGGSVYTITGQKVQSY